MATQARKSRKANNGQNSLFIFFAIVIVLAIVSIIIAYFYLSEDQPEQAQEQQTGTEMINNGITEIEGTWVSNYDGRMLTIDGLKITLESPSVDQTEKISGQISIEGNIVTIVYASGPCEKTEGHYLYTINDSGELFFKLIKDNCKSREERMSMTWFKL